MEREDPSSALDAYIRHFERNTPWEELRQTVRWLLRPKERGVVSGCEGHVMEEASVQLQKYLDQHTGLGLRSSVNECLTSPLSSEALMNMRSNARQHRPVQPVTQGRCAQIDKPNPRCSWRAVNTRGRCNRLNRQPRDSPPAQTKRSCSVPRQVAQDTSDATWRKSKLQFYPLNPADRDSKPVKNYKRPRRDRPITNMHRRSWSHGDTQTHSNPRTPAELDDQLRRSVDENARCIERSRQAADRAASRDLVWEVVSTLKNGSSPEQKLNNSLRTMRKQLVDDTAQSVINHSPRELTTKSMDAVTAELRTSDLSPISLELGSSGARTVSPGLSRGAGARTVSPQQSKVADTLPLDQSRRTEPVDTMPRQLEEEVDDFPEVDALLARSEALLSRGLRTTNQKSEAVPSEQNGVTGPSEADSTLAGSIDGISSTGLSALTNTADLTAAHTDSVASGQTDSIPCEVDSGSVGSSSRSLETMKDMLYRLQNMAATHVTATTVEHSAVSTDSTKIRN